MSSPAPLSNYSELVSFLQKIYMMETPSAVEAITAQESHPEDTTLVKSDQERVRDLAQYLLQLPLPYITPQQLQEVMNSWSERLSITAISGAPAVSAAAPLIGLMESALITTAVQEWARTQLDSNELLQETLAQENKNPLALLLQKYVASNPTSPLASIDLKQTLSTLPVLSALLQMAPEEILAKAYLLSEQQAINTMLERWIESEAKNAAALREDIRQQTLTKAQLRGELMAFLLEKSQTSEAPPPVLFSIILFGGLFEPESVSVEPAGQSLVKTIVASFGLPESLIPEWEILTQGIMLSSVTWAAPSAISLLQLESNSSSEQVQMRIATKASCLSLIRTLENPEVVSFLRSRMAHAVSQGIMTEEESVQAYATIRSFLFMNAAIALYAQETGGVTAQEMRAIIEGTMDLPEGSLLRAMGTFIRLEIDSLSPQRRELFLSSGLEHLVQSASRNNLARSIQPLLSLANNHYNQDISLSTKG